MHKIYLGIRKYLYIPSYMEYLDLMFTTCMLLTSVEEFERHQSGFVNLYAFNVLEQKVTS